MYTTKHIIYSYARIQLEFGSKSPSPCAFTRDQSELWGTKQAYYNDQCYYGALNSPANESGTYDSTIEV